MSPVRFRDLPPLSRLPIAAKMQQVGGCRTEAGGDSVVLRCSTVRPEIDLPTRFSTLAPMSSQSRPRRPLLAVLWALIAVSQAGYYWVGDRQWFRLIGPVCALVLACLCAFRAQTAKEKSS